MLQVRIRAAPVAAAMLVLASACSGLQRPLDQRAPFDPGQAYVAGRFERLSGADFGFSLRDARGDEHKITFGRRGRGPLMAATGVTALPPGDYVVAGWIYGETRKPLPRDKRFTFHVAAGHVLFLGNFLAVATSWREGHYLHFQWKLDPLHARADEVVEYLTETYPAFKEAKVECLLCDPPGVDAAAFAMPAEPAPAGFSWRTTVIHFRARAATYDSWGLEAWESFEKPEEAGVPGAQKLRQDRPVAGMLGNHLVSADGVDDFGAYWQLTDADFGNGRVNFTLRSGAVTDVAGRSFLVKDGREGWVNEADPVVYHSREAADAAWKR